MLEKFPDRPVSFRSAVWWLETCSEIAGRTLRDHQIALDAFNLQMPLPGNDVRDALELAAGRLHDAMRDLNHAHEYMHHVEYEEKAWKRMLSDTGRQVSE